MWYHLRLMKVSFLLISVCAVHILLTLYPHLPSPPLTYSHALLKLCSLTPPPPGCTLNRQDVRLTLHYEKGFTVTREPADPAGGAVLYRYPYEKLKMSADDGIRNLYLDFGGPEGEMVGYTAVGIL